MDGLANAGTTYTTNGRNQYGAVGGSTSTYDGRGNLTGYGGTTWGYDAENRLTSASTSGGTTLTYDPLGRLWRIASPASGKTGFVYDSAHVAVEYDGDTGGMRRRFFWGPGADEPILQDEGGAMNCSGTRVLHQDERGSVVAAADCYGVRQAVNTYDESGIPGAGNAAFTAGGRYGYTGQAWLPELGLWFYKNRMYVPWHGRFMQTDPIGYGDGLNLYAYVKGDPVNRVDPSGLDDVEGQEVTVPGTRIKQLPAPTLTPGTITFSFSDGGANFDLLPRIPSVEALLEPEAGTQSEEDGQNTVTVVANRLYGPTHVRLIQLTRSSYFHIFVRHAWFAWPNTGRFLLSLGM